jgi:hypothetical protein
MKTIQAVPGSEEYQSRIDEIHAILRDYQGNPRLAQSPEALEELEQAIRNLTEELAALVTGQQIQHSLDCEPMQEAQSKLAADWPHRLKNHEREGVWVRTANGYEIWVKARYFIRKGNRSGKRRYRGFYLGLLLLGIHERCTGGFAAEVSLLAAMLGSLAEAQSVLAERGVRLDIKVLRQNHLPVFVKSSVDPAFEGPEFAGECGRTPCGGQYGWRANSAEGEKAGSENGERTLPLPRRLA